MGVEAMSLDVYRVYDSTFDGVMFGSAYDEKIDVEVRIWRAKLRAFGTKDQVPVPRSDDGFMLAIVSGTGNTLMQRMSVIDSACRVYAKDIDRPFRWRTIFTERMSLERIIECIKAVLPDADFRFGLHAGKELGVKFGPIL